MRRRLWLCTALVLPLAGCTAARPTPTHTPTSPPAVRPAAAISLVAFDSCAQLAKEMQAAAAQIARRTRTDLSGNQPPAGGDGIPMPAQAAEAPAGAAARPAPATAFSGTNIHEAGADEPDIVKTDGRRIVTVDPGGVLRVIDPATRTQTGRLALGSTASQLLLSGDHALVLTSGSPVIDRRQLLPPQSGRAEVLLVDLTGRPRVISRYRGDGRVIDARQTGSVARVVLSTTPSFAHPLNATADTWLPQWEITTGTETVNGKADCRDVRRPPAYSGTGMLTVLTFDLNAPALSNGDPVTVVSDGDIVYGTPDSLYLANDQRWRGRNDTEIFKFALPPAGKPELTASGAVPGVLLNQYALSEWDHHLRVATTDRFPGGGASTSAVRVLAERDGKLTPVGVVDGLGRGERIYSVRFIGARGYVVTFRQTDPLYSLDLSDPARPRVTGELKINGYSAHLQPVGDDRLIGIGQDASAQGVRQGLQISLFDIADPARPRRLAQEVVPGAQSEAEFDPHALLWWPATRLLVVPASGFGALALRVDPDGLGRITELAGEPIRRALVIGDELWTLTGSGMAAADLSTMDQVGRVSFS